MKNTIFNKRFKYTYNNATLYLVIINVFIYLLINSVWRNGYVYLSMQPLAILHGYVYQFITYMFVHGSFTHILFNMLSLYIFGTVLEKRIGTKEFLLYYFLVGILSGIASFVFYYLSGQNTLLLGASGAIYGLLLLFAVFFPFAKIYIFGILPVKAPFLIVGYFFIELFSHFYATSSSIAHLTHLSGLVFGFLYCLLRMKINPIAVWKRTL